MRHYVFTALLIFAGCAAVRQQLGSVLVPLQTEVELGDKIAAQIEEQEKIHSDRRLQTYIRQLAAPLIRHSMEDRPEITYHITVLDNPEQVNAFAVPGGHLYVYTGLLLVAANEAEVAGILAHEIGHVVGRHSANQLATQYGLGILASLALGENPEEVGKMASEWIGSGALARFSRDDEREADKFGVKYTIAAGYDPRGLLTFFQKMKKMEGRRRSELDNLLASHPATEERIRRIEKMIAAAGSPGGRTEAQRYLQKTAVLRR